MLYIYCLLNITIEKPFLNYACHCVSVYCKDLSSRPDCPWRAFQSLINERAIEFGS